MIPSIFDRSDTHHPGHTLYRVPLLVWGPWCYSRRSALWQWFRVNLGLEPNDRSEP